MVCPLDTAAVTELWRLELFSCTSSFSCAGALFPRGKCCYFFFVEGLVGVDKHVFQIVSLVTSVTLSLDYILDQLLVNVEVIPKHKRLNTV